MTEQATAQFTSVDQLGEECARGLRHLLLAAADTKLLLGYHYGEWTFGTPKLEAAVASCSLAQAELGHIRLLHAVLHQHWGDHSEALVNDRAPHEYANIRFLDQAVPDWPGFVAANFVVDLAVTRLLHACRESAFQPICVNVDKILDEERYHLHHGRGWFRTLAADDANRSTLVERTTAALRAVAEWCGPSDELEDRTMVEAGVKAMSNPEVYEAVRRDVEDVAATAGAALDVAPVEAFEDWTPANRRVGGGGPDEEILFHLRGNKNELFRL
jgi:ring-1,2-phenylacetyl-CoA epoxidase subunit PaaC